MTLRVLYFGTYDRGVGRNAVLLEGLRAAGVEVVECHTRLWRDTTDKLASARRPARTAHATVRLAAAWRRLLACHARAGSFDVVLVGATAHLDLPLARLMARRHGRLLVFDPLVSISETIRDRALLPPHSLRLAALAHLEHMLFRLPDLCLADTSAHADAFTAEVGLDPTRTVVLPAGTPPIYRQLAQPYSPLPHTEAAPFRVAYFGQYIPLHGLETVLRAAAKLRGREDIAFELVGKGQMLPEIKALADRQSLPNVRFHEAWLPPERLAGEHVAPADLCLGIFGEQPKAGRVVPYKVYTALASGRPVVTADTPAVREFLAPGDEVWTVPPADPDALATAIAHLADRPDLRGRLAQAGQAAYDVRFAPPVLGAQLRDVLLERLGGIREYGAQSGSGELGAGSWVLGGRCRTASVRVAARATQTTPGAEGRYTGPRHEWRNRRLARALLEAAPEGPVLDAGCGYGKMARLLAEAGRVVYAFDPDPERVDTACAHLRAAGVADRVLLFRADATAIPLSDGTISGAAAGEVLEHIANDRAAVAELARVLVPGGALAITVPAGAGRFGPADRAAGHLRRYDRADLLDLLSGASLIVEHLQGWGFPFGRLYDRLVQRPALAVRERRPGRVLARLARHRTVTAAWALLFAIDNYLPAGDLGSGWLAVARRREETIPLKL